MLKKILDGFLTFIFNWFFSPLVYFIFRVVLGWKVKGELPDVSKMMCAFAPHTSNFDFFYIIYLAAHFKVKPNWIGKKELFEGPFGKLSTYTGGIAVDRDAPLKALKQIIKYIKTNDQFILCIAPEGTRHYTDHWKKGFYFIANKTDMPIVFFKIDYNTRVVTAREAFYPTGDMDADLEVIKPFFADAVGRYPDRAAPIQFADEM
ncbi:MAG: 1-acyl-sn-glycerol-3-phosphate acyltransferase [Phototrophicaceae bacterium]